MWLTGTVRSSMRLYSEPAGQWDADSRDADSLDSAAQDDADDANAAAWNQTAASVPDQVLTPTAFALFPKDLAMAPRALAERHFRVERFTVMPHGGHFAALEQPALLAEDLVRFLDNRF